ncbi:DUF1573 domain-containing protein [Singulisphaera sp. GP187]|uniref:DUF1573 domain-containing protein n=1 Tax=Singulisphaera sp. GP187 TaxID=1882752 RepID=UPI0013566846|nr:DUF1573 domain-containing protein [Singulisphaera sp. GP187]
MSQFLITTNVLIVALVLGAITLFGSVEKSLKYLSGNRVFLDSASKSVGHLGQAETKVVTFKISNSSGKRMEIVGAKLSCTCLVTDELPLTIGPKSSKNFNIRIDPKGKAGSLKETVILFTSLDSDRTVPLEVVGDVSPPSLDVGGSGH